MTTEHGLTALWIFASFAPFAVRSLRPERCSTAKDAESAKGLPDGRDMLLRARLVVATDRDPPYRPSASDKAR